jgi:hypothetical protein
MTFPSRNGNLMMAVSFYFGHPALLAPRALPAALLGLVVVIERLIISCAALRLNSKFFAIEVENKQANTGR